MLAGQIPSLAGLRRRGVAWGRFAACSGVEVGAGAGAVAVGGNGFLVDMIDYGNGNVSRSPIIMPRLGIGVWFGFCLY